MNKKILDILKSQHNTISIVVILLISFTLSFFAVSYIYKLISNKDTASAPESENCNVYGINLHGGVVTYNTPDSYNDQGKLAENQTSADDIEYYIDKAQASDNVKAILLEIDSFGGSPVAGEEMMKAVKDSKKPVVALIRSQGLSAAYLAASGAKTIFASNFSDVGSIGVTMSYLQNTEKNQKDGMTYVSLSAGKYKDIGNPDKAITEEEKQLLMRDVNITYDYFVNLVAKNRNLSISKVKALADGSSMMGASALKNGLIDKIGILPDAKKYLAEQIGEDVNICWQN
jgi:signal peptide peptidase SppA